MPERLSAAARGYNEMLTDATEVVVEDEQQAGRIVHEDQVTRYIDRAFQCVENTGGLVLTKYEVAAMRRSLEWVAQVIAATASNQSEVRYLETLGLLGRIGEPRN
jgi:hypothetical protein